MDIEKLSKESKKKIKDIIEWLSENEKDALLEILLKRQAQWWIEDNDWEWKMTTKETNELVWDEENWLTQEKKDEAKKRFLQQLKESRNKKWYNKDEIIDNLKNNYVKTQENVEMMWYKWKTLLIELPAKWKFKWFKFDCFITNDKFKYKDVKESTKQDLYSKKEISTLFSAIREYMEEYNIWCDWDDYDYENQLDLFEKDEEYCFAWDFLKKITWLNDSYLLSDAALCCSLTYSSFNNNPSYGQLFLKISE